VPHYDTADVEPKYQPPAKPNARAKPQKKLKAPTDTPDKTENQMGDASRQRKTSQTTPNSADRPTNAPVPENVRRAAGVEDPRASRLPPNRPHRPAHEGARRHHPEQALRAAPRP